VTMFERMSDSGRRVMVLALEECRRAGHPWVGTEHLLLGVLALPDAPGVSGLTELGVTVRTARPALAQVVGKGGWDPADAEALRGMGIDLDQLRHRVEAGGSAVDHAPPRRWWQPASRRPWHREPETESGTETVSGNVPFLPRTKEALQRALGEARSLDAPRIDAGHILLGLLDPQGNTAVEVLLHLRADPQIVRERVLHQLSRAT
jgi:ATP-dependent Clp protease ATP-binding subunit ClpA